MSGRTARPLSSLALLAALACAPGSAEDPASATTDTGTTDTGAPGDACQAPDPAAVAAVSISFGGWPKDQGNPEFESITVDAACTVKAAASDGGTLEIELRCSQGELVDLPIWLHVEGPADFAVDLAADTAVELSAYWQGGGHHIPLGYWFALHDTSGGLLLAGLDLDAVGAPEEDLAPVRVGAAEGACAPTCENGCTDPEWDTVERLAVDFAHEDGSRVEILDGSRGQLRSNGRRYDIVVAQAERWFCLNCGADYTWILRQADQQ